jgi:hypothetical protein
MFTFMEDLYYFFFPSSPSHSFFFSRLLFTFLPSLRFSQLGQVGLKLLILLSQPSGYKYCKCVLQVRLKLFNFHMYSCCCLESFHLLLKCSLKWLESEDHDVNCFNKNVREVDRKKQVYSILSWENSKWPFHLWGLRDYKGLFWDTRAYKEKMGRKSQDLMGHFSFSLLLPVFHSMSLFLFF